MNRRVKTSMFFFILPRLVSFDELDLTEILRAHRHH